MEIKTKYINFRNEIRKRRKLILILSLVLTLLFSIYNRIIGAIKESLWHESISIYYFLLVLIKSIILIYLEKSKERKYDARIFNITKGLLIVLNILLIVPITLLVLNKRMVEMSLVFSIAIALYVTIKTTKSIVNFVKQRKTKDILLKELKVIDLTDVVVSILTLQNTLIAVNGEFDQDMYYLTIASSVVGFLVNMFLIISMKRAQNKIKCKTTQKR